MKCYRVILLLLLLWCYVYETNGKTSGSGRTYSHYSYGARAYSTYNGYSRTSYRYSTSSSAYRSSNVRTTRTTTPSSGYYSYYVGKYYNYYSYSTYNAYYGGLCYTSSTAGTYCSTTTTTVAPTVATNVGRCGGTSSMLSGSVGTFTSHQYWDGTTSSYGSNMNCQWLITVQADRYVQLQFVSFNVEKTYDIVRVYDGAATTSTMIGEYYNHQQPPIINSTGQYLHVIFSSDASIQYTGFSAVYYEKEFASSTSPTTTAATTTATTTTESTLITTTSSTCNETLTENTATSGSIQSHSNFGSSQYSNMITCTWTLIAQIGHTIRLRFVSMNLETCYDKVTVYDGHNSSSYTNKSELCLPNTPTGYYYSSSNAMHITFTTDVSITRTGFLAVYEFSSSFTTRPVNETGTSPENRNPDSNNVCSNYDANINGTALGSFTCPNPWEPKTFTQCCGESNSQFCCEIKDNAPMIAGIVLGVIAAIVAIVVILYCIIKAIREKPEDKTTTKSKNKGNWKRRIRKVQAMVLWTSLTNEVSSLRKHSSSSSSSSTSSSDDNNSFEPPPIPPPSNPYAQYHSQNSLVAQAAQDVAYPPPTPDMMSQTYIM